MYLSITSCIVSQILIEWITYFCVISNRSRTSLIKLNVYSLSVRVVLGVEARIMLAAVLPALEVWRGKQRGILPWAMPAQYAAPGRI